MRTEIGRLLGARLTQLEFAQIIGISAAETVCRWEDADGPGPSTRSSIIIRLVHDKLRRIYDRPTDATAVAEETLDVIREAVYGVDAVVDTIRLTANSNMNNELRAKMIEGALERLADHMDIVRNITQHAEAA